MHRKPLTIEVRASEQPPVMRWSLTQCPLRFSEGRELFGGEGRRWFASFFRGPFCFSDLDQKFGLLSCQFTATGLSAAFPDLGEILADFAR
jgi:hypothetical protein